MRRARVARGGVLLASVALALAGCSTAGSGPHVPQQDGSSRPGKDGGAPGTCACMPGFVKCGSGASAACTDITTSASNCGACGNACPSGSVCKEGTCNKATACDPVAKTGCAAGMKCAFTGLDTTKHIVYGCVAAGTQTAGQTCTTSASGDTCVPGEVCLGGMCYVWCGECDPSSTGNPCPDPQSSTYCTPAGAMPTYCVGAMVDMSTPPDYLGLICYPGTCDIYSGGSCTYTTSTGTMMSGGTCIYIPGGPFCTAPGTVAAGGACTHYNDCVAGDSCFPVGSSFLCEPNCDTTKSGSCASGTTCHDACNPDLPHLGYCM